MNKMIHSRFIIILLTVVLCGCGPKDQGPSKKETPDLRTEIEALKSVPAASENSSPDEYMTSLDVLLQAEEPAGALEGGKSSIFLGASKAFLFKKHLMVSQEQNWDELVFVTDKGEKGQERFGQGSQEILRNIGPVAGTDHCLVLDSGPDAAGNSVRYFLTELDENRKRIREIPLVLSGEDRDAEGNPPYRFAMDAFGMVHLSWPTDEGWRYQLLSSDGEYLAGYTLASTDGEILELVPLYDGRIAFWTGPKTDWEIWKTWGDQKTDAPLQTALMYLDPKTGKAEELSVLEKGVYFCTLLDEKTLLYADRQGIYQSGLSGKDPELLYLWVNHGVNLQDMYALVAEGTEKIRLICEEEDGCHYLCLEPSAEKQSDICEITLAVSPYNSQVLIPAAAEFNKKYPGCHIRIRDNYEETALLTELIAGEGPVLVDTALTGFADQEELWEQMDLFVQQMGITEALWPAVLEAGKINGMQYGLSVTCGLWTLGIADPETEDWDYDTFLKLLEQYLSEKPDADGVYDSYEGDGVNFIIHFFIHGVEDSYFWDAEKGITDFDSKKFRTVLKIAKEYVEDKGNVGYDCERLLEGMRFCTEEQYWDLSDFMSIRVRSKDRIRNIGYPTAAGAAHMLCVRDPLAVRSTASYEEKLAAYAFLDFCISYDMQLGLTRANNNSKYMSVRKDMLETQLADFMEDTVSIRVDGKSVCLRDHVDVEKDSAILREMFEGAKPWQDLPRELMEILEGELGQYFAGTITENMLIDHLENRVQLYLNE